MKLSELARDSWATSILALIPFGALFWVREEYGRAAFTDLFAAIAAYAALWFVIWAMRGGDQASETRPLEGNTEGLDYTQCGSRYEGKRCLKVEGHEHRHRCPEYDWTYRMADEYKPEPIQVQSEEGGGDE